MGVNRTWQADLVMWRDQLRHWGVAGEHEQSRSVCRGERGEAGLGKEASVLKRRGPKKFLQLGRDWVFEVDCRMWAC